VQVCIEIFKNKGHEVDYKVGLPKDELIRIIGNYDGLVVRSATKVTADVIQAANKMVVIGRAGEGSGGGEEGLFIRLLLFRRRRRLLQQQQQQQQQQVLPS